MYIKLVIYPEYYSLLKWFRKQNIMVDNIFISCSFVGIW